MLNVLGRLQLKLRAALRRIDRVAHSRLATRKSHRVRYMPAVAHAVAGIVSRDNLRAARESHLAHGGCVIGKECLDRDV